MMGNSRGECPGSASEINAFLLERDTWGNSVMRTGRHLTHCRRLQAASTEHRSQIMEREKRNCKEESKR